jgi:glutamyl-tRNA reductase
MLRVGVIGINHKLADLKLRERLAKVCQKRFGVLHAVHEDHYFVLLSTCNRIEIYFSSHDLPATHSFLLNILRLEVNEEFDHKLYSYFGMDCLHHLTRVILGLDSAVIAETEIQGQVKTAYENIAEAHSLPKELHFLFQKALNTAKKIRSELPLGRGMPNLEYAILQAAKHVFAVPEETHLLFIGASEINLKILNFLKAKRFQAITLCNRSDQYAHQLSTHYHIQQLQWAHLHRWNEYDWIIFGTKSTDYLITKKDITQRSRGHQLIMDLCVPRNVDPHINEGRDGLPSITLLNIDEIIDLLKNRRHKMTNILAEAEERIAYETAQHIKRYEERSQNKISYFAATG